MVTEMHRRWAILFIAFVLSLAALREAQPVFAPLTLAFVTALVLSPISDFWARLRVPGPIGALISLVAVLALLSLIYLFVEPAITELTTQWPLIRYEIVRSLHEFQQTLRGIEDMTEGVKEALAPAAPGQGADTGGDAIEVPGVMDALLIAPAILGQLLIFAGGLFFILLCRADLYAWIAQLFAEDAAAEARINRCLHSADGEVARYFFKISLINLGFGLIVAIALKALGMHWAPLWGLLAALMNFILYLGPAIVAAVLVVGGMIAFDGFQSFLPALTFVGLNTIEGQFVTPSILGRHMQVNPLMIFLSLCVWLWLWGAIGGIVAIPVLVWGLTLARDLNADAEAEEAEIRAAAAKAEAAG